MKINIKDVGYAVFFLIVITLVAVEAAEAAPAQHRQVTLQE